MERIALAGLVTAAVVIGGCAASRDFTAFAVPAWDVVETMPLEPPEELSSRQQRDFRDGWHDLQRGNLRDAASELEALSRRYGRNSEISTARGYLELRLGSVAAAERYFQIALRERPEFGPAQSGFVLAALAAGDEELAYERLVALEATYPQHALVDRYMSTLQVNVAETRLRHARGLMEQGNYAAAAAAYVEALEVVPGVGDLYLETAEAELAAELPERALHHAERATELEPENAEAHRILGEARYAAGNVAAAYEAYRMAARLSPRDSDIHERMEAIGREHEETSLPPEYQDIRDASRLTREQLAALLYVELRSLYEGAPTGGSVIATDISNSWASSYIRRVLQAGIMEVYPNHMFQPKGFVRRAELADGLASALELLAPEAYRAAKESTRFDQSFADLGPENLNYESAALAVSLGLMMTRDGGRFAPQEFVSGAEAVTAVNALAAHMTP